MSLNNRYEFVMLFDVENGNPNGDPDAGNAPRIDMETGFGFVTDVCIKRKIRNYVQLNYENVEGYNILIQPDNVLDNVFKTARDKTKNDENATKVKDAIIAARNYMCKNYFDVRAFGAVMSTGDNPAGIVRGPVQINFAKSISPVNILDVSITRQAKTNDERKSKKGDTEMGRKSVIPYALYRAEGYVSAAQANRLTGLSEEDLEVLWKAIINMFEDDHSAARGKMCMRKLYVFRHDSVLGDYPSYKLFDKIKVEKINGDAPPRAITDYKITADTDMPDGVTLLDKIQ